MKDPDVPETTQGSPHEPVDWQTKERLERREIRRYLGRLFAIIALGALGMVALGLYLYQRLDAGRGETTRRVPVEREVDAEGKVHYVPRTLRAPPASGSSTLAPPTDKP